MKKLILAIFVAASALLSAQTNEALPVGTAVTLVATSNGDPAPTFEWFKGSTKIATGATYAIPALALTHAGSYTVKATNSIGSATSPAYILAVGSAPSIPTITVTATKPNGVSITVPQGTTVNFQKK